MLPRFFYLLPRGGREIVVLKQSLLCDEDWGVSPRWKKKKKKTAPNHGHSSQRSSLSPQCLHKPLPSSTVGYPKCLSLLRVQCLSWTFINKVSSHLHTPYSPLVSRLISVQSCNSIGIEWEGNVSLNICACLALMWKRKPSLFESHVRYGIALGYVNQLFWSAGWKRAGEKERLHNRRKGKEMKTSGKRNNRKKNKKKTKNLRRWKGETRGV